jgi:hypothetical protein
VLPLALLGFAVTLGWTLSGPTHALERNVGLATFALLALMFLRSSARIIEASVRKTAPAHLDPFV